VLFLFFFPDAAGSRQSLFWASNLVLRSDFCRGVSGVLEFLALIHFSDQSSLYCTIRVFTLVIFFTGSSTPFAAGLRFFRLDFYSDRISAVSQQ
jgi:hypothetical protein